MRRTKDHHPHHAGHRHAGIAVGERAKRSGPQPGQTEFSAAEEQAMRNGGGGSPAGAAPAPMPSAPAPMGPAPGGSPPMGGSPVPQDLDSDGGM